jgi:Putative metallopeptidase
MNRSRVAHDMPAILLALTLAASAILVVPAAAQNWKSIPANPDVELTYVAPEAPELQSVYQRLKERQVLEELQHFLAPLRLPHLLHVRTAQCNQANAFYSSSDRSLTLCYELVEKIREQAPKTASPDGFITRQAAIIGGVIGVVLHESGHMIFDMFDVPIFGREEDAADETASFLALQFNRDVARTIIKGFVYQWAAEKDPPASGPMTPFADEHGTASQRMYNTLCLAYGGDPQTFQEFVDRGWLPKARAEGCGREFELVKFAFETTIFPFIDANLMARVKQAQWLNPDELK